MLRRLMRRPGGPHLRRSLTTQKRYLSAARGSASGDVVARRPSPLAIQQISAFGVDPAQKANPARGDKNIQSPHRSQSSSIPAGVKDVTREHYPQSRDRGPVEAL